MITVPTTLQIFFVLVLLVCAVSVFITHVRLIQIQKTYPEILVRAGIKRIDWWWSCLRGIYRLGFTPLGADLPIHTRTAFRLSIATYAVVPICIAVMRVTNEGAFTS